MVMVLIGTSNQLKISNHLIDWINKFFTVYTIFMLYGYIILISIMLLVFILFLLLTIGHKWDFIRLLSFTVSFTCVAFYYGGCCFATCN